MSWRLGISAVRRPQLVGVGSHRVAMTHPKTSWTRAEIGALGERLAVEHLIAADDATRVVVFVEVKTRTSDRYGGIEQAVTPQKVRRLRRLAGLWLARQDVRWSGVRIDVVGVRIGRRPIPEITHLRGVG
jgi:putative endonuclease